MARTAPVPAGDAAFRFRDSRVRIDSHDANNCEALKPPITLSFTDKQDSQLWAMVRTWVSRLGLPPWSPALDSRLPVRVIRSTRF
ncbi:hypothetical protein LZ554_000310 [Drepanopeziza brunnea f. sp. 'monogermtubi']|nr:hypothetical protein LZ554_000310 [Drepanopeziza brunnea f. sp. 'monogermtubi']